MTVAAHKETLSFQAEVQQLLQLMIHSLYSNKEIFLRELVSNASDASDKLRFEALTDEALYEGDSDLTIRVSYDKDARTLTVADNGIGMSRQEVVDNLGTIARSGTREFVQKLTGDQAKDAKLIGQFGVGFYSAFIIADQVTVLTRRAGLGAEHGVRWESDGSGAYTLETVERAARGTEVTLHLREGEDEFLDEYRLRNIIHKYSDHISIPVLLKAADKEERVNRAAALWTRPRKDVSEEEYAEFYKHIAHDFEGPLAHVHTQVEGTQSYTTLFFIPPRAPFDLWDRQQRHGVKLYVRRVFIMDAAEQLMPAYLRFMRGVVDSDDLPLNVSREILQHSRQVDAIRNASVKKVLGLLEDIAKTDQEKYAKVWQNFGQVIKEGPGEDFGNRERIAKLLRFASTRNDTPAEDVSLEDYVSRMKPEQKKIYYIVADSFTAAQHSPHLEVFRHKGIEVLLLHSRIDEWLTAHLTEFDGKPLQSVAKGDLDIGEFADEDKQEAEQAAEAAKPLVERMQKVLGEKVKSVRVSSRLTSSPACLVVQDHDMGIAFHKMLKAAGHDVPSAAPILEINAKHALVAQLENMDDEARFADWTRLLFDQALLAEGGQLDDPSDYVRRLNDLLLQLTH